jgi:NAD(P)-dependent dehydrogenase (short-subunit alcohol dehydrogenase family)
MAESIAPRLAGRAIVITGAASGIGAAAAQLCIDEGARVLLVDRDAERLAALAKPLGTAAVALPADVSHPDTAAHYVEAALSHFGRLDGGILNAAIAGKIAPIHEVTPEDFDQIMAINVRSVWSGMAALIPHLKAAGGGSIVATASIGGLQGSQMVAPYIASKHAVIGLVKSAALECARHNIRVNAVAPSPIDTPMMAHINTSIGGGDTERSRARTTAHVPMRRYGRPEEVARMMVFLMSEEASFSTGGVYLVDGGLLAGF